MNVLIRADASLSIGSGHIMRCLTLANAIKASGGEVEFACKNHPGNLIEKVNLSFKTHTLALSDNDSDNWLGGSWQDDAKACAQVLKQKHYDWLIIDHYEIDTQWQSTLRPLVSKILVIDDLANRQHNCDILLDQNIPLAGHSYTDLVSESTNILHGPRYCLLRPEFLKHYPQKETSKQSILVFLGGADQQNLTEAVVKQLTCLENINADIVIGGQNQQAESLKLLCSGLNFNCHINITNIAEVIAQSDIVIIACGFTCYEAASMKKPAMLIPLSDIQMQVANELQQIGVATVVEPNQINSGFFYKAIQQLSNIDEKAFDLFNNDGAKLVIENMEKELVA